MLAINMVLFWITIGLIMITISGLVYVLIKQRKKIIIHVIIISVSSITVAFTQQMAIVYGTTTGGNPTFLMSFTKIKWNCFMA